MSNLNLNGWECLCIFIMAWCITEIVKHIVYAISIHKAMKALKDMPEESRAMMLRMLYRQQGLDDDK